MTVEELYSYTEVFDMAIMHKKNGVIGIIVPRNPSEEFTMRNLMNIKFNS